MQIDALQARELRLSPRDTDINLGLEFGFVKTSISIIVAYVAVIGTVS